MDADEERNFVALLSQSTALPARPTWSSPTTSSDQVQVDPWANPFASSPTNLFTSLPPPAPFARSQSAYLPSTSYPDFTYNDNNIQPPNGSEDEGDDNSPYVQKLEEDQVVKVEPPSVIAAKEREELVRANYEDQGGFGGEEGFESVYNARNGSTSFPQPEDSWGAPIDGNGDMTQPPAPPTPAEPSAQSSSTTPGRSTRMLPADLIDDDLMAASDPSISLKKAFVKSTPAPTGSGWIKGQGRPEKKGAYVFRPAGRSPAKVKQPESKQLEVGQQKQEKQEQIMIPVAEAKVEAVSQVQITAGGPEKGEVPSGVEELNGVEEGEKRIDEDKTAPDAKADEEMADIGIELPVSSGEATADKGISASDVTQSSSTSTSGDLSCTPTEPAQAEDQPSETSTPTVPVSESSKTAAHLIPLPDSAAPTRTTTPLPPQAPSPPIPAQTPIRDRVAVSPLEPPTAQVGDDFGFQSLAIGAASVSASAEEGWGAAAANGNESGGGSRFGGKVWDTMDDDEGLFGKVGPANDPWGATASGWGGENTAGPSVSMAHTLVGPQTNALSPSPVPPPEIPTQSTSDPEVISPSISPSKPRRKTHPVFTISISDPARIGDPVRGYTVYTLRTRTTSPHYRKSEFTALRRFSDFLWLFDSLIANNPGIIVPPVPDKHTFGRFQEQFIETRRLALERSLNKIAGHPVLQLDPDLRLFLESDNFAVENKQRRPEVPEIPPPTKGLLGGWSTPKFIENDDWFASRNAFLDALENQLKSLSKSIESASKSRLDMAQAYAEVSTALGALSESDLGSTMCASLSHLADLNRREKEGEEDLVKGEVVNLLNMADEYIRFVGSVRRAMGGRVRVWWNWQGLEREVGRLKGAREKLRAQGRLGDRAAQTLAEINEIDRRARLAQQEFDQQTKLVKSEFARFERERVDEFKRVLERYLEAQIARQREVIMAWEDHHAGVLGMVRRAQGVKEGAQHRDA